MLRQVHMQSIRNCHFSSSACIILHRSWIFLMLHFGNVYIWLQMVFVSVNMYRNHLYWINQSNVFILFRNILYSQNSYFIMMVIHELPRIGILPSWFVFDVRWLTAFGGRFPNEGVRISNVNHRSSITIEVNNFPTTYLFVFDRFLGTQLI